MKYFDNAKIGDKIYVLRYGKKYNGYICNIYNNNNYPINVVFIKNNLTIGRSFTREGSELTSNIKQVLFYRKESLTTIIRDKVINYLLIIPKRIKFITRPYEKPHILLKDIKITKNSYGVFAKEIKSEIKFSITK